MLAATLPVLRSRGLTALPVTYIGKAATFALMSGLPAGAAGPVRRAVEPGGAGDRVGLPDLGHGDVPVVGGAVPACRWSWWCGGCRGRRPGRRCGDRSWAGYDPHAGRTAHEADAPTLIPVPSLLRSLLSDHLDPGYAAAAASATRRAHRRLDRLWQVAAAALVIARCSRWPGRRPRSTAPGVRESQQVLAASVRSSEAATEALTARRDGLAAEVDSDRAQPARGRRARPAAARRSLDQANFAAAATTVIGPGLTVTRHRSRVSPRSHRRVQGAGRGQPSGDPRPRPAAGGELAVGQRRRGDLGRRRADRPQRDDPAGGRRRSWSTTSRSPARTRSWRSARRTRCTTPSTAARAFSGCGCWRRPTASGSPSAPATR